MSFEIERCSVRFLVGPSSYLSWDWTHYPVLHVSWGQAVNSRLVEVEVHTLVHVYSWDWKAWLSSMECPRNGMINFDHVIKIRNTQHTICYLGSSCDRSWYEILHGNHSDSLFVSWCRPVHIHRYQWHIPLQQIEEIKSISKQEELTLSPCKYFQCSLFLKPNKNNQHLTSVHRHCKTETLLQWLIHQLAVNKQVPASVWSFAVRCVLVGRAAIYGGAVSTSYAYTVSDPL